VLVDDPSPYVRRSVANHLNDITKDHPDISLDVAQRWLTCGDGAAWAVHHGLRSLVKRGDVRALGLLGVRANTEVGLADFVLDRSTIRIGDSVTFTFTLVVPPGSEPADCIIDYRVHFAGVRGTKAPKVFKLTRRRVESGRPLNISRRHRFEHVSIRRILPGLHQIDLQVNGNILGSVSLEIVDPSHPIANRTSSDRDPFEATLRLERTSATLDY
jgi:hypothetical protein